MNIRVTNKKTNKKNPPKHASRSIYRNVLKKKLSAKLSFDLNFMQKDTFVLSPRRLPIIQGATAAFLMPVFALMSQPEWSCPFDQQANGMNYLL